MLLSVCIPTWNRASFIRLSARFWLEQMAPLAGQVELIIADNASTDGTVGELEALRDLGFFRLIQRPVNLGFNGSTFDLVARQAQGEFVWVCGDDDYLNRNALARVVTTLEANRDVDHFHAETQFVPKDYAPDLATEDPRDSPHVRRINAGMPSGRVARTREILEFDPASFTGFYSSIWRRAVAVAALSGEFAAREPFASLEATLPYAVYVARRRMDAPCLEIAAPVLTVVHTISWPHYASFFRLKIMPDLLDLLEVQRISADALRKARRRLLDHWPIAFVDLFRRRREMPDSFSFSRFFARHFFEARFWKELGRYLWCDLLP